MILRSMVSGAKFKVLATDAAEANLRGLILSVCGIVGIKTLPEAIFNQIMRYVFVYNGNLTIDEMYTAFELNLAGRYKTRHEHYQNFDLSYWSSVMNDYMQVRNLAAKSKTQALNSIGISEVEHERTTPEQSYNSIIGYVRKNNAVPKYWDFDLVYTYMERCNLISLSEELLNEIRERANETLSNEALMSGGHSIGSVLSNYKAAKNMGKLELEYRREVVSLEMLKYVLVFFFHFLCGGYFYVFSIII